MRGCMCATGCHDWRHSDIVPAGSGANLCCSDWDEVKAKYCSRTASPPVECLIPTVDQSINEMITSLQKKFLVSTKNTKLIRRTR